MVDVKEPRSEEGRCGAMGRGRAIVAIMMGGRDAWGGALGKVCSPVDQGIVHVGNRAAVIDVTVRLPLNRVREY